jgi:ribokinase
VSAELLPPPAAIGEIVVVGSMMIDQITYCERVPADGETLLADRYEQGFGGKGANQAVMAARLGADVALIGCVGDDDLGRATIDNLDTNGVDAGCVRRIADRNTGVAPIWVDGAGANRILIAPGANRALDASIVADGFAGRTQVAIVLAQLETPQSATYEAFRIARRRGAVTILNPAPAAAIDPGLLAVTDWLIPNESEYEVLFGSRPEREAVAADGPSRPYGLVVTLGAAGALVAAAGATTLVSAPPAALVADTTGAGDAFVGAFAVGLAGGLDPVDAARLGCFAGSLSVRRPGTQRSFPSRDEIEHVITINERGEP